MIKHSRGFTVIEILFVVVLIGAASIIFFIQKHNLSIVAQDNTSKTAINAMYYGLEEVFYPANQYYPQTISSSNLKSVDPSLFTDQNGIKLGAAGSTYTYSPTNCTDGKCKSYTLKTTLNKEADYTKTSRNN
ncbi:MAG: type II secretion system protein [Candidatus Saccharibacteria bacterium]